MTGEFEGRLGIGIILPREENDSRGRVIWMPKGWRMGSAYSASPLRAEQEEMCFCCRTGTELNDNHCTDLKGLRRGVRSFSTQVFMGRLDSHLLVEERGWTRELPGGMTLKGWSPREGPWRQVWRPTGFNPASFKETPQALPDALPLCLSDLQAGECWAKRTTFLDAFEPVQ